MADKTTQTIYIDADPGEVMKAIADIEAYPQWISEYKEVEILEADDEGYPKRARMLMDAAIFKDTLIMSYELAVDLAVPMIGMLKRKAERRLIDGALKDLKKRVEG